MKKKTPKEYASLLISTHAAVSGEEFVPDIVINHALMSLEHCVRNEEKYHHLFSSDPITKKRKIPFDDSKIHRYFEQVRKEIEQIRKEL